MYYYEKDYIMRMIHGMARVLARLLLAREMEEEGEVIFLRDAEARSQNDLLRRMIDAGQVNQAEEKLFDLLETAKQLTASACMLLLASSSSGATRRSLSLLLAQ